jgi:biopolymer transport protein ExbB/TolQ
VNKISNLLQIIFKSPLVWGIFGSAGFYTLIFGGPLDMPLVKRYFTGHPVEYMETVLFSVGLAALILKAIDMASQRSNLARSPFGHRLQGVESVDAHSTLLKCLDKLPGWRQEEFFIRRLRSALEHVRTNGSAQTLNDELKYMSDIDASRMYAGFGLFRVILWAIPILGFLGTVVGITMALNSVDLKSPDQSMLKVLNGLGLKFDTTALALAMSMVLMFVHFFVDRSANTLLERVDRRVEEELAGRFQQISAGPDGQLVAVRRMAETMVQAAERLVEHQTELWRASVEHQNKLWRASMEDAAARWTQIAKAEVIEQAVAAVGEVARLENALNGNLNALAGAKHFEQTVMSLAAAINLLNARLAEMPAQSSIKLDGNRRAA